MKSAKPNKSSPTQAGGKISKENVSNRLNKAARRPQKPRKSQKSDATNRHHHNQKWCRSQPQVRHQKNRFPKFLTIYQIILLAPSPPMPPTQFHPRPSHQPTKLTTKTQTQIPNHRHLPQPNPGAKIDLTNLIVLSGPNPQPRPASSPPLKLPQRPPALNLPPKSQPLQKILSNLKHQSSPHSPSHRLPLSHLPPPSPSRPSPFNRK